MSKKPKRHFFPLWLLFFGMAVCVLYLGGRLIYGEIQSRKVHQEIVELGELSYDEAFLEEISKAEGFLSVSPVYEIPVKLRWEDYTMETSFTVLDFDEFHMTGTAPEMIEIGNTPILLIGEKALSGFTDFFGNPISEKTIKKFWASADVPTLEYTLSGDGQSVSSGAETTSLTDTVLWRPCLAAGCLTAPSEGIYVPLAQLDSLTPTIPEVEKVLLKTQGTKSEIL